jgi:hypothetical protein
LKSSSRATALPLVSAVSSVSTAGVELMSRKSTISAPNSCYPSAVSIANETRPNSCRPVISLTNVRKPPCSLLLTLKTVHLFGSRWQYTIFITAIYQSLYLILQTSNKQTNNMSTRNIQRVGGSHLQGCLAFQCVVYENYSSLD